MAIDCTLFPCAVESIAVKVVKKIKATMEDGEKVYVFGARKYRIKEESFACLTTQGGGRPLITNKNGDLITSKMMKVTYGWKRVEDLYTSTCPNNVNEVEKRVHQLLFEEQVVSKWTK